MISFIIPVLNEAKFIEQTFKTINKSIRLAKNIKKFEIIVVDDGSQDGIKDKINVLKSRYRNIVFVQNLLIVLEVHNIYHRLGKQQLKFFYLFSILSLHDLSQSR